MSNKKGVTGRLRVQKFTEGQLVQDSGWIDNVITTVMKNELASSPATSHATHMGFGTSTTAVAAADTVLGAELTIGSNGYNRVAVTKTNPSGNVVQYVSTLTGLTASTTIQEAGLFSAATAGKLFAHQLTGAYTLAQSADSLQVTWQVTYN
jgi:hypothetical protein